MKKNLSEESALLRFFRRMTQVLYRVAGVGVFGRFLSSYEKWNDRFENTSVGRMGRGSGRLRRTARQHIAVAMEHNAVTRGLFRLRDLALTCGLRTMGLFLLVCGAYIGMMYWLADFVWKADLVSRFSLVAGIAAALIGVILMFSDLSAGYAVRHSLICRKMILPIFDCGDDPIKDIPREGRQYYAVAVPLGMAVGTLSALFSPLLIFGVVLLLLLAFLEFTVPEAGVMMLFVWLPLAGALRGGRALIAVAVLLPLIGYYVKFLRGNRVFRMELQDLPALLLVPIFLLSGFSFAEHSWQWALWAALAVLVYFPVVNVLATPGWAFRCRIALIFSGVVSSVWGILQFIFALAGGGAPSLFVRAGFTDCTTFSYFLILVYPFALYTLTVCRKPYRLPALLAVAVIAAGTVLSTVQSSAAAVLLMTVCFLVLADKRFLFGVLGATGVLAAAYAVLPKELRRRIALLCAENDVAVPVSHLFRSGKQGGLQVGSSFSRFFFGLGSGGGEEFSRVFSPEYVTITAQNTNFFGYALCSYGFLGVFVILMLVWFLFRNSFSVFLLGKGGSGKRSAIIGICFSLGVFFSGFFHYTWYDPAVMALFFAVAGLIGAQMRLERKAVSRAEKTVNDSFAAEYEYYPE